MRRILLFAVSVLITGFPFYAGGQIPERTMFQPGTYGFGPYIQSSIPPAAVPSLPAADSDETDSTPASSESVPEGEKDDLRTEWEKAFAPQQLEPHVNAPAPLVPPAAKPEAQPIYVPHLAFAYDKKTQQFRLTPYEGGYAASPAEFPRALSPLHNYFASPYSASQIFPQVRYMSYYEPDPVILPAAIKQRWLRFMQNDQPIPIPSPPQPETPRAPRSRDRITSRSR
jgi:hypothetical protein